MKQTTVNDNKVLIVHVLSVLSEQNSCTIMEK